MSNTLAVIPTYLRKESELEIAKRTLVTLKATADCEVLVVDDGSPLSEGVRLRHELFGLAHELGFHTFIKAPNEGFATTVNVGLREARENGMDAVLINSDIEFFEPGWLEALEARDEEVAGALLLYPNGLIQHAGIYHSAITRLFGHILHLAPGNIALAQQERICPVTAALHRIKHSALVEIGLYDEKFRMGFEDVDYCYRVFQAGGKCVYEPKAKAFHHEGIFRRDNPTPKLAQWQRESSEWLVKKHAGYQYSEHVPTLIWPDDQ